MLEKYYYNLSGNPQLNMYRCGTEDCLQGHSWGPGIRDHYLIHFINSGRGVFRVGNISYNLKSGHGFLIVPDVVTYYQADWLEPWSYSWVGFNGSKAEEYLGLANLSIENPVFEFKRSYIIKECFSKMMSARNFSKSRETYLLGTLYNFFSILIEELGHDQRSGNSEKRKYEYIAKVIEYINMNYSREISVQEISHYIGLARSYLSSLFKERLDISLQEFIINFRINKSCELMRNENLSIGDISRSVGYKDPLLFSKVFKKCKGMSPKEYRKANQKS